MGTLFNQDPRYLLNVQEIIDDIIVSLKKIIKEEKLTTEQALKIYEVALYRQRSFCYKDDGDRKDEQLKGFGDILVEIRDILDNAYREDK